MPPAAGTGPGYKPPAPRMARQPGSRPAPSRGLTDVVDLFKESWEVFQRRFSTLIGLLLLCVVASVVPAGAAAALAAFAGMALGKLAIALIGGAGLLASIYLGFRCFAGFLHAVADERLSLRDAMAQGEGIVLPLIWIGFLTGFIIGGGFLLLIVPGIIFTVWFCFTQFILIQEESTGMDALLKSREYVRGEWFNVALRLLLVWAASLLIGAIPFVGPILSIVFFPYVMIFHYLIYRDLRQMKGDVPFPCSLGDQLKWPGVALLGYVVVPAALISVIGLSVLGPMAKMASREGVTLQASAPGQTAGPADQGLRVITFPQQQSAPTPVTAEQPVDSAAPPEQTSSGEAQPFNTAGEESPENVHVFIYAVNYTGTIKANGKVLQEMEGKPEMQYNYNMSGRELRYGQNLIEVEYAELPSHSESLLKVKMEVSRQATGKAREILGEWTMEDKGRGTKSFTLDIPK